MRAPNTLALCALLALLLVETALAVHAQNLWTRQHDRHFQKYSKRYFGADFDWRWWKAQAMAESAMDSTAESWCGAQGLMQIMPKTWDQIAQHVSVQSPWNVRDAIQAGIWYDARMWAIWTAPRPVEERVYFTLASYNAGAHNIIRAQRLVPAGQNANAWLPVATQLHRVTGHHHQETIGYVERIRMYHDRLRELLLPVH